MPDYGGYDYGPSAHMIDKRNRIEAKLKKLGINPRSTKYNVLYFRWMRQR